MRDIRCKHRDLEIWKLVTPVMTWRIKAGTVPLWSRSRWPAGSRCCSGAVPPQSPARRGAAVDPRAAARRLVPGQRATITASCRSSTRPPGKDDLPRLVQLVGGHRDRRAGPALIAEVVTRADATESTCRPVRGRPRGGWTACRASPSGWLQEGLTNVLRHAPPGRRVSVVGPTRARPAASRTTPTCGPIGAGGSGRGRPVWAERVQQLAGHLTAAVNLVLAGGSSRPSYPTGAFVPSA